MQQNPSRSSSRLVAILNLAALAGVLVVNTLAVTLPLNGRTTKELSDMYPNLFVPAGLTFAIWGIIYLLLIAFALYQASVLFHKNLQAKAFGTVSKMGYLFFISCLANIGWIFSWHYQLLPLSLLLMLVLLITLIIINLRFDIFRSDRNWRNMLLVQIPFGVYLGWISIATIANITALLVYYQWSGWGISAHAWTIIMLIAASIITLLMLIIRKNIFFALVVLWAFYGIILKRIEINKFLYKDIIECCGICIIVISIVTLIEMFKLLKFKNPH